MKNEFLTQERTLVTTGVLETKEGLISLRAKADTAIDDLYQEVAAHKETLRRVLLKGAKCVARAEDVVAMKRHQALAKRLLVQPERAAQAEEAKLQRLSAWCETVLKELAKH